MTGDDSNPYATPEREAARPPPRTEEEPSTAPTVLAILACVLWLLPVFGLPLAIIGLVVTLRRRARHPDRHIHSLVALIVALVLSVANAAVGASMALTGNHPLVQPHR